MYALVPRVSARAVDAQRREYTERKLLLDRLTLLPKLRACSLWERRLHRWRGKHGRFLLDDMMVEQA